MDKKTRLLDILGVKPIRDNNMPRKTALRWAAIVTLTQWLDFLSTYIGVSIGAAREANPTLAWAMEHFGWWGFIWVKAGGTMLMLWLSWRRKPASLVFIAIYTAVVVWNTHIIVKWL